MVEGYVIEVLILTGYLGAGKTSVLNHLLSLPEIASRETALIINEFGSLNVDGGLVPQGKYAKFELNKGSVFCICIKTDFLKTLSTIADEVQPELVIIEATGIAQPCDLEDFLEAPNLAGKFEIKANICLVDVENFSKVAPFMKAAQNQVIWADGIALNKTDLVSAEDVERVSAAVRKLNPDAPRERVSFGKLSSRFIESLKHVKRDGAASSAPPEGITAVALKFDQPVKREKVLAALNDLGDSLLRAKGTLDFGEGPIHIEVVFQRVTETVALPESAKRPGLTVIVQGLESDYVRSMFS